MHLYNEKIHKTSNFTASKFSKTLKRIINKGKLFDEFCLVKIFVKEKFSNWRLKNDKLIEAEIILHIIMESYGNDNIFIYQNVL